MRLFGLILIFAAALSGCPSSGQSNSPVTVRMHFDRKEGLYAAPFPSDDLRRADGTLDLSGFPNPSATSLVTLALGLITRDARGFALAGGIFLGLSGPIDPTQFPDLAGSMASDAPVFLMSVDPKAPDFLHRYPVEIDFEADGGPFGDANLLSLLPLQGVPLRENTTYAAVVLSRVRDTKQAPLGVSDEMKGIAAGTRPEAMSPAAFDAYTRALDALRMANVPSADIAGLAVFTTDTPTAKLNVVRDDALSRPIPAPSKPFVMTDVFPEFCVYASTIALPVYQGGTPPYDKTGGGWTFDPSGKPIFQRFEEANFLLTIPRTAVPAAGFPTTFLVRAGGKGARPLVDRGQEASDTTPAPPGTGPALHFARAGFAGVAVDGPLMGLRNLTNGDEQFLLFNVFNPEALRDNVRQSAIELALLTRVLENLTVDTATCPGVTGQVHFDLGHLALMGHSSGATISPLALAAEPRFHASIMSGAGASWIQNVMYKKDPLVVRPIMEIFLGYTSLHRSLTGHDPVLTLFQWGAEPADSAAYTRGLLQEPPPGVPARQILMFQGIVDHYIMPPIANAMSLSLGLDLGGPELDAKSAELAGLPTLASVLPFAGRKMISLPASGNVVGHDGSATTAVVVQHPSDGIEDGHEIVYQTDPPKHQYRCFLASYAQGMTPVVLPDAPADAPCTP